MDPRSQDEQIAQIVKQHIKKYESKIKSILNADTQITNILNALHKKLDAFNQNKHSYEEWVAVWEGLEKLKEAVTLKLPFNVDEENIARQKRYKEDFTAAIHQHKDAIKVVPNPKEEHYRLLNKEEYQELFPERIKNRAKIEALIRSDEHRALSLAQLIINKFVNENYPSTFFIKKFARTLNAIKTTRIEEKNNLWQAMLQIYQQRKDEKLKITEMKQIIINTYFAIRKSPDGSEGIFFGKGSRLADELEKFIKKEIGISVPHRVKAEQTPLQIRSCLEDPKIS